MPRTRRRPARGGADNRADEAAVSVAQHADVYAWTAVYLVDGRVVSIAWLRGWPGAVAARWDQ